MRSYSFGIGTILFGVSHISGRSLLPLWIGIVNALFVSLEMIIALVSLGTYAFLGISESV